MDLLSQQSTILMEFQTDKDYRNEPNRLLGPIVELLEKHAGKSQEIFRRQDDVDGITTCMFLLCRNSFVSVQLKSPGLILLNIDIGSEDNVPFSYQVSKTFEKEMKEKLPIITKSAALTPIKRGGILNAQRYLITSDERIIEYDVDHVVVDHQSPFQRIQILHTINFGNVLILDENQNLAESDLIYTETLMQRGKIDYKDKEVLILGGGDGALLSELMKEKPKMVTMVEIDEDVIKFCRQHLRSACGSALDSLSGDNYKIVIGDCLVELDKYLSNGTKFDFVFGDLTEIPLSDEPQSKEWEFLKNILHKSLQLLKCGGQFLTHGAGVSCVQSIALLESHLQSLTPAVTFQRCEAFIPSWMESWVFYQIERI